MEKILAPLCLVILMAAAQAQTNPTMATTSDDQANSAKPAPKQSEPTLK